VNNKFIIIEMTDKKILQIRMNDSHPYKENKGAILITQCWNICLILNLKNPSFCLFVIKIQRSQKHGFKYTVKEPFREDRERVLAMF
jgi:hypothetical protein